MSAFLGLLQQQEYVYPDVHMAPSGWIFLGLAWAFVTGLLVWSFVRVLGGRRPS